MKKQSGSGTASSSPAQPHDLATAKVLKTITIPEAKDALLRSGYILEHRVENLLRSSGWDVQANVPYKDPDTQKSRELDIYAITARLFKANQGALIGTIIAECVNNPQPVAFITKEEEFPYILSADIKLELGLEHDWTETQGGISAYLGLDEFHHYCSGRVATQFCSFAPKDRGKPSEWIAKHDEVHFECFNTLIKALEHQNNSALHVPGWTSASVVYPLLVLQGEILDVRLVEGDVLLEPMNCAKYRRSVIWENTETGYIIDVVTERGLPDFLDMLELELTQTAEAIQRKAEFLTEQKESAGGKEDLT